MLFENIEEESKKDQRLSGFEKSIISGLVLITKIVLWKVKQAKTYGDLMKLGLFIKDKIEFLENKYPGGEIMKNETSIIVTLGEIDEVKKELKNL